MLGDAMPWFLPLFVVSLIAWLLYGTIENYANKQESSLWQRAATIVRWLPVVQISAMILVRYNAVVQRDSEHLEVAQFLGQGEFESSDLLLLATGDGGGEIIALIATLFAIQSHRLPSLSMLEENLQRTFRVRMMLFTSFLLLFSSSLLFPESAYYQPVSLPLEPIGPVPALQNALPLILFGGMLMFVGEMFAASTMFLGGTLVRSLIRKMRIKVAILLLAALVWLGSDASGMGAWMDNLPESNRIMLVVVGIHLAVCFGLNIQPAVAQNAELMHGVGKSKAIVISGIVMSGIVFILTPLHLHSHGVLGSGWGALLYATWMTSVTVSAMFLVQFMPAIGFDAAPRPEMWWMTMVLALSPLALLSFTQFAIFLMPSIWIALAWGNTVPWFIESDVPSPKLGFLAYPLAVASVVCAIVPFLSEQTFLAALWFTMVPCLIACIGLTVHVKSIRRVVA